jgi:hypothetical protein
MAFKLIGSLSSNSVAIVTAQTALSSIMNYCFQNKMVSKIHLQTNHRRKIEEIKAHTFHLKAKEATILHLTSYFYTYPKTIHGLYA